MKKPDKSLTGRQRRLAHKQRKAKGRAIAAAQFLVFQKRLAGRST